MHFGAIDSPKFANLSKFYPRAQNIHATILWLFRNADYVRVVSSSSGSGQSHATKYIGCIFEVKSFTNGAIKSATSLAHAVFASVKGSSSIAYRRRIMAPYVIGQAIIFSSCGFFFLSSSSFYTYIHTYIHTNLYSAKIVERILACSQPSEIGCLPYFHTWCGLSVNLECRSEMRCMRLAENTGHKNLQKFAVCALSHNFCRAVS